MRMAGFSSLHRAALKGLRVFQTELTQFPTVCNQWYTLPLNMC